MREPSQHDLLRQIPAVDQLLLRPELTRWIERTSRGLVVSEVQRLLDEIREGIRSGAAEWRRPIDGTVLETLVVERLERRLRPRLVSLINATGVVLHTNLGRAPLSEAAREALASVARDYCNLEYDVESAGRSLREGLIEPALTELLGCEAATVVNNNAAAIFLILNTLAAGREVVVSRGELIEIGGSFRIPEILAASGAVLREVGTTNKTRASDYAGAINPATALLLRIHPSNYRIRGFTERPELEELVALAHERGLPLVEDIGSGCLLDLTPYGIADEPMAPASLQAGADLVCFSGDKILGGPQAGIIAGAKRWVEPVRRNPLMRTYRVEKLVYAALEATLGSYRTGRALEEIPVLRLIAMTSDELRRRARRLERRLRAKLPDDARVELVEGRSVIGGGSCPDCFLPTTLVAIASARHRAVDIEARLRAQSPSIIARVEEDRPRIDLRTVFRRQERQLEAGLIEALS